MTGRILIGDCRETLRTLPDQSVHCVVTSPPYFGLRDYGTGEWVGGDPSCEHGVKRWEGDKQTQGAQSGHASASDRLSRSLCSCGAKRQDSQIGLEPTPDEFVVAMVEVFREVRRVLRDDGTLFLNLGDSYAANRTYKVEQTKGGPKHGVAQAVEGRGQRASDYGLKAKDLIGIPWMVAFALRADGWYLRQDIIWAKPNPMPESVRDRCTKAHEYVFMLTKSPRYYYDHEAVKEPAVSTSIAKFADNSPDKQRGHGRRHAGFNGRYADRLAEDGPPTTRNRRSVWTVGTKPFAEAHFATYPPDLIEPCVLAGCPVGGTVLDPFFGAGTTGLVAERHGRNWIGCELNPAYAEIAERRIAGGRRPITSSALIAWALAA